MSPEKRDTRLLTTKVIMPEPSRFTFQVVEVLVGTSAVPYKALLKITFSGAVKRSTLTAPGTVNVDILCRQSGRTASNIPGRFMFVSPKDIAFLSSTIPINPLESGSYRYTINIVGTDAGAGRVTDSQGVALDGDQNGFPGGNYVKEIEVVV